MKKLVFVMNCHGDELMSYMQAIPEVAREFTMEVVSTYANLDTPSVLSAVDTADVVVANNIKSYAAFTPAALRRRIKPGARVIVVEFFRFDGYNAVPFIQTPYVWCSQLVLSSATYDEFVQAPIDAAAIQAAFQAGLEKLRALDAASYIKVYDFFVANHQRLRLFRDPHHPSEPLYHHMLRQLIPMLGAGVDVPDTLPSVKHSFGTYVRYSLIPPAVKRELGLAFNDDTVDDYLQETCTARQHFEFTHAVATGAIPINSWDAMGTAFRASLAQ